MRLVLYMISTYVGGALFGEVILLGYGIQLCDYFMWLLAQSAKVISIADTGMWRFTYITFRGSSMAQDERCDGQS